jgi:hypothetical protein
MKRALLIVAAFAMTPFDAFAQDAGANPIQVLEDCVMAQARRLEISGESADIVATAAVAKCGRELTQATPQGGVVRSNAEARQQLKDAMREQALVQIVERRAAAKTPPPPPPKEPARKPPVKKKAAGPIATVPNR